MKLKYDAVYQTNVPTILSENIDMKHFKVK